MKKIFKFRMLHLKWVTFYLFPRDNWTLGITFDKSPNEYPLLDFSFIFFSFDIIFAPNSYFNSTQEEKDRIEAIKNLSDKEKCKLIADNLFESIFGINTDRPEQDEDI